MRFCTLSWHPGAAWRAETLKSSAKALLLLRRAKNPTARTCGITRSCFQQCHLSAPGLPIPKTMPYQTHPKSFGTDHPELTSHLTRKEHQCDLSASVRLGTHQYFPWLQHHTSNTTDQLPLMWFGFLLLSSSTSERIKVIPWLKCKRIKENLCSTTNSVISLFS